MKMIDRINDEKYTHLGISKNGTTHLGFWDDDKDRLVWVAAHNFRKCKILGESTRVVFGHISADIELIQFKQNRTTDIIVSKVD